MKGRMEYGAICTEYKTDSPIAGRVVQWAKTIIIKPVMPADSTSILA